MPCSLNFLKYSEVSGGTHYIGNFKLPSGFSSYDSARRGLRQASVIRFKFKLNMHFVELGLTLPPLVAKVTHCCSAIDFVAQDRGAL